jgi:hypothetical protein
MPYSTNFATALIALVNDLPSAEKIQFGELLFEKSMAQSSIADTHRLLTGIRDGNVIPILKKGLNYGLIPFANESSCDTSECSLTSSFSSHKWDLGLSECNLELCLRTFEESFLQFFNEQKRFDNNVDLDTALLTFIKNQVTDAVLGTQWRNAYFGDKSLTTNTYLNGINGFFTQAEANPSQIVNIIENNETTYAAQKFSSGQRVYDILEQMDELYTTQDWFGTDGVEIKMTALTARTLVSFLNGLKETTCCNGIDRVNPDGLATRSYTLENLSFRGMPIRVMKEWDNIIETPSLGLNGGGGNNPRVNPHRILLTYPDNLLLATSDESNFNMFDIWHSKDKNKVIMKVGTYFGAGIPIKNEYILGI